MTYKVDSFALLLFEVDMLVADVISKEVLMASRYVKVLMVAEVPFCFMR